MYFSVKFYRLREKGFTLLELLIIIAILAILAMVAVPNINTFRQIARAHAANSELAGVKLANKAYAADHDDVYAADSSELNDYLNHPVSISVQFNPVTGYIVGAPSSGYDDVYWDASLSRFD